MPAIIIEICFCEVTEDTKIYREKGPKIIGKLIAEGICNKEIETNNNQIETEKNPGEKWEMVTASILNLGFVLKNC